MPGPRGTQPCLAVFLASGCFLDLTALDARSANTDALSRAVYQRAHGLQVDVPPALGYVVRVADPVAELRPTPADITYFRHSPHAPLGGSLSLAASGSRSQAI